MIRIITAIANPILNNKLNKKENIKIIGQDIQYQEGIFETLEYNKIEQIDFIFVSELLPGELKIDELVTNIKEIDFNINIIVILEKRKKEIENILYSKGVFKIIYNNEINIEEIIKIVKDEKNDKNKELKEEIEKLKNIIIKNSEIRENKEKNNINKKIINYLKNMKIINKKKSNKIKNEKEIISISGPNGTGKSIISVNLAKAIAYEKAKVLIIDFDILNSSLHTILGIKKYPNKKIKEKTIKNSIIKVNKKIDLISATEILFNSENKLNVIQFQKELSNLKNTYDVIIIDTSSECFFDYTRNIIQVSNKNIFVTEANILEIKKAKSLLNIYINEWKIDKNKFNILFNKYNSDSINLSLLKKIFCEFNIIGTLKYDQKYNKLINKNNKINFLDKQIRGDYLKIKNNIKKGENKYGVRKYDKDSE